METWDCLKCDHENEWENVFDDEQICSKCNTTHTSDYEVDYDAYYMWITGLKDEV